MLQHVLKLNGVKSLKRKEQESVNGGGLISLITSNCQGKPNGTRCFYNNHSGCPGECYSGSCHPY